MKDKEVPPLPPEEEAEPTEEEDEDELADFGRTHEELEGEQFGDPTERKRK